MQYLFDIIIGSLIFIYDILFTLIYRSFGNPAIAIIILSIVINLIVLPLYKKADALQKEELLKKKSMARGIKHIRKTFKHDEQFMMLSAYYKSCQYNPLSFLKESVPLFLQIPFFIAAYRFISSLSILDGASFGPISNLIEPDKMLVVGTVTINILPILMTVINLISGAIYSKGSDARLKVQIVVTALIFLVLLYNSPSGLVLYWTMNNLFSLAKNAVQNQSSQVQKTVKVIMAFAVLIVAEIFTLTSKIDAVPAEILVIGSISYILVTLCGNKIKSYIINRFPILTRHPISFPHPSLSLVLATELALCILLGLYIPSTVLSSSAREFVNYSSGLFNYDLLIYPLTIYVGLLMVWTTVIFYSYNDTGRIFISVFLFTSLFFSVVNQFIFTKSFGTLYTDLQYDEFVSFPVLFIISNALAGILILVFSLCLFIKRPSILKNLAIIIALPLLILSIRNVFIIDNSIRDIKPGSKTEASYDGILRLSRTGNNVIVFMLDRAIGEYIPYIFDEKPELLDSYRGFVYYPNTVSLGRCTNIAAPALFGGYEYSPDKINQRINEPLVQKYDEALLLMPALFSQNGYDVTVVDPPYAGYSYIPDLSIYDDYSNVNAYSLNGVFSEEYIVDELNDYDFDNRQKRNFIMFSLFRTSPAAMRSFIYDNGKYIYNSLSASYPRSLIDSYSTLNRLTWLTSIDDNPNGSFLLLQNDTPHNPTQLIPPDYDLGSPLLSIDTDFSAYYQNRVLDGRMLKIGDFNQWQHYCINIATYEELAVWMDYLQDEGVYDNTRIILVSDHGYNLFQFPDLLFNDLDVEIYRPLLMVKDFSSNTPFSIDSTFMTNADVPLLAMSGIINDPVNPFTGNPITDDDKTNDHIYITSSYNWGLDQEGSCTFDLTDSRWLSVRDNVYNPNNWRIVSEEEVLGQ